MYYIVYIIVSYLLTLALRNVNEGELLKNFLSEFCGTFIIIFFGLASIILFKNLLDAPLFIALTFSTIITLSFSLFSKDFFVTFNPFLSFTAYIRAFISMKEFFISFMAQIIGAFFAVFILYLIFAKNIILPSFSIAPEFVKSTDLKEGNLVLFSSFFSSFFLSFLFFSSDFKKKYNHIYIGAIYFISILVFYKIMGDMLNPLIIFVTSIFAFKFSSITMLYFIVIFFGTIIGGIFSFFLKNKLERRRYV